MWIAIVKVFGLTQPGVEPESIVSVADVLSIWQLIGCLAHDFRKSPTFFPKIQMDL